LQGSNRLRGWYLFAGPETRTPHLNGLLETFRLALAEIQVVEGKVLRHRLTDRTGDAHAIRVSQLFDALGKDHPGTGHRVVSDDDFTEADTDAKLWLHIARKARVEFSVVYLEGQRRCNGVRCACELRHQGIAAQLVSEAILAGDDRGKAPESVLNPGVGGRLVHMDERRGTNHVGMQNDRQLT
jgi:hypothetical protein